MTRPIPRLKRAAFLAARSTVLAAAALVAAAGAHADDAAIRRALAERMPQLPKIDEIRPTPIPGIFELRLGTDVLYADGQGDFLIQGSLFDTKAKVDLTQARVDKLTAIDVASLPLKDALLIKQGSGARRLVVFADPNCGYCKRLEKDLVALKDVSIYTFVYPILGPDSTAKSRDLWCAKDPGKAWRDWMVDGVVPPKAIGACDAAAIERNVALGRKFRVTGTPALVFDDGARVPGAIPAAQIEQRLAGAARKS